MANKKKSTVIIIIKHLKKRLIIVVAGDNMNIFLNENWRDIMKDLSPALSEALGEVFRQTLTSMADLVPYQTLFPRD